MLYYFHSVDSLVARCFCIFVTIVMQLALRKEKRKSCVDLLVAAFGLLMSYSEGAFLTCFSSGEACESKSSSLSLLPKKHVTHRARCRTRMLRHMLVSAVRLGISGIWHM